MSRFLCLLAVPLAVAAATAATPGLQVIDRAAPVVLEGPRLSRTIASDIPVELPLTVRTFGSAAERVGMLERIPLGIEDSSMPLTSTVDRELPLMLKGLTIEDALDQLSRRSSTYEWREIDRVVVIRPKRAWKDPHNTLNRRVGSVEWKAVNFADALDKTMARVVGMPYRTPRPTPDDRRFDIVLPDVTLLELLNAIVTEHGELTWHVGYRPDDPKEHFGIGFKTFDGHGRWIWVPETRP